MISSLNYFRNNGSSMAKPIYLYIVFGYTLVALVQETENKASARPWLWELRRRHRISQYAKIHTQQGISLSEICAPPWKVKTFMVTRWDLQSKFRWSLTAWTMLFTTTLALLVKRKYFILNLIGRQRVIPCTSDSKQFN